MDSNITLRSNVYINQSAQRDDKRFLQHITDYRVLKKYKDSSYGFQNNMSWMTSVQMEILRQGQPNCSLERALCLGEFRLVETAWFAVVNSMIVPDSLSARNIQTIARFQEKRKRKSQRNLT